MAKLIAWARILNSFKLPKYAHLATIEDAETIAAIHV
jgi:hypothetical protein